MSMTRDKLRRTLIALMALVACGLAGSFARAQDEAGVRQQAKDHYEKATRFYDVGKYGEAIAEYEQSYLLIDDPALLFNIGQAYRLWDRPEEAIRSYKNYLRRRPDASNRADVEKKIADLERALDERRRSAAPMAEPAAPAAPSTRSPSTESAPAVPPEPMPPPPSAPMTEPPPVTTALPVPPAAGVAMDQPVEPAPRPSRILPYSLIGVGGACLLTSLVAAAVGASKAKKLQEASQNHDVYDPALQSSGKAANAVAVVFGLAGLASGGIGGYLLWRDRARTNQDAQVSAVLVPGYAGASLSIAY
jgi:tetratricopeptide (TPR) repeat protein